MNIQHQNKMAKLLNKDKRVASKTTSLLKCKVTAFFTDPRTKIQYVVLDGGLKSDCFLNSEEFKTSNLPLPSIDEELNVSIINFDRYANRHYVSFLKALKDQKTRTLKRFYYSSSTIAAEVIELKENSCIIKTSEETGGNWNL